VGDAPACLGVKVEAESQETEQADGNSDSCCQCVMSSVERQRFVRF
jgi:hypothetical protein